MPGYEDIYQAALQANTKKELKDKLTALKEQLGEDYDINDTLWDEKIGVYFSAASRLAYEDKKGMNVKKIQWLHNLGAGAGRIIKSYAMATPIGDSDPIKYYFEQYKDNPEKLRYLRKWCVDGYIFSGNHTCVDLLYAQDPTLDKYIAIEYARANNPNYAFNYYSRMTEATKKEQTAKDIMVQLAKNGVDIGKNPVWGEVYNQNPNKFHLFIVEGYARTEKTDLLINYLDNLKRQETPDFERICDDAFYYSASSGHHKQIEELYKNKDYLSKNTNQDIIQGYKLSKQHEHAIQFDLKEILKSYLEEREKDPREYKYNWLPKFFQKSLTNKQDAVALLTRALNGENVDLMPHLETLRNGNLGRSLRAFLQKGRGDYLEVKEKPVVAPDGGEIRTVTDLVKGLNQIIHPEEQTQGNHLHKEGR